MPLKMNIALYDPQKDAFVTQNMEIQILLNGHPINSNLSYQIFGGGNKVSNINYTPNNESIDLDEAFANINMNNIYNNFTPDTTYIQAIQPQQIEIPQLNMPQIQVQYPITNENMLTNNNQQMQNPQEVSLMDQVDFVTDDDF